MVILDCPTSISKNRLNWFFVPIWRAVHINNDMWSAVYCAKPRKGKSWLTLSHAHTLDRGSNDKPRFPTDCSRVFFSAGEFAKALAKKHPSGTVFILDDAGLNLFSRDAMSRTVIDVAKIFQSIRFKNYIILLSLPAYNMLDKAVRTLMGAYVQPNKIDSDTMRTRAGVRFLNYNPNKGEVYHKKPTRIFSNKNTWLNYEVRQKIEVNEIWFDAPPKELRVAYEAKKERCLGEYYDGVARDILAREEKKEGTGSAKMKLFAKAYNEIVASPESFCFVDEKGLQTVEVAKVYEAYPQLTSYNALRLCGQINTKLKAVHKRGR